MTQFSIKDLQEQDKDTHAFLEWSDESYVEKLKTDSLMRKTAGKSLSSIDGKTIAIKENFVWTQGKTNAGSKILEDFESPYTATAVQKIIDAGGIIVGKTNMDEFGMGSSTENSAYGPTKNPYDVERVPGGSSGGSAAAVASNMVDLAIGTDTGGSIRQPAALCGVVGYKPTYGAVSRYGVIAMASSLDVIGPFAKKVKKARELFDIIAGKDKMDATSIELKAKNLKLKNNLNIGVPKEFYGEGLDPRIKQKIDEVLEKLKSQGAEIIDINLPTAPLSLAVYYIIMPVEVSSNLARYDGIRFGLSAEKMKNNEFKIKNLMEIYTKSRAFGFGAEVKRRIMLGTYASSAGYADKYYHQAQIVRQEIKKEFNEAFTKVDAIITPTTPTLPFKFGEKGDDPLKMYLEDIYTVPANIAGIPAISVPIGTAVEIGKKLPIGMQILGKQRDDYMVFDIAEQVESMVNNEN